MHFYWNETKIRDTRDIPETPQIHAYTVLKKSIFKTFYNTIIFSAVEVKPDPILFTDYNLYIFVIRDCVFQMDLIQIHLYRCVTKNE